MLQSLSLSVSTVNQREYCGGAAYPQVKAIIIQIYLAVIIIMIVDFRAWPKNKLSDTSYL